MPRTLRFLASLPCSCFRSQPPRCPATVQVSLQRICRVLFFHLDATCTTTARLCALCVPNAVTDRYLSGLRGRRRRAPTRPTSARSAAEAATDSRSYNRDVCKARDSRRKHYSPAAATLGCPLCSAAAPQMRQAGGVGGSGPARLLRGSAPRIALHPRQLSISGCPVSQAPSQQPERATRRRGSPLPARFRCSFTCCVFARRLLHVEPFPNNPSPSPTTPW